MGKYDDIIDLPHHISADRPQMSMHDRAAQFSPFAALVGYDDCVSEAARLTDNKAELSEDRSNELNGKIQLLKESSGGSPRITVEYFTADKKKAGGAYFTVTGDFKKIDEYRRVLVMSDGTEIPLDDIYSIEGIF